MTNDDQFSIWWYTFLPPPDMTVANSSGRAGLNMKSITSPVHMRLQLSVGYNRTYLRIHCNHLLILLIWINWIVSRLLHFNSKRIVGEPTFQCRRECVFGLHLNYQCTSRTRELALLFSSKVSRLNVLWLAYEIKQNNNSQGLTISSFNCSLGMAFLDLVHFFVPFI